MTDRLTSRALALVLSLMSPTARAAWDGSREKFAPPEFLNITQWAEKHREVVGGFKPGRFELATQPVFRYVLDSYADPVVREIVVQKSSQIGYSVSVELNVIGYHIHQDPCAVIAIFPQEKSLKKFVNEKLDPTIEGTNVLARLIPTKSRNSKNTLYHKRYPAGFLALGGGNSIANVKSTDARVVLVSEPDDVSKDVKNQGDGIALAKARCKAFADRKIVIGGTPTLDELSSVQEEMEKSDKRRLYVRCPHCDHAQTLRWEQVQWLKDADTYHPVYGRNRPETAGYLCESEECGTLWTDEEKNAAVVRACDESDWRAHATFREIRGIYMDELHSINPTASFQALATRLVEAEYAQKRGDETKLKEFWNGTLGLPYKRKSNQVPQVEVLREKSQSAGYAELTVPSGALILAAGVDVQRGGDKAEPRLEVVLRAWGRNEESWLTLFKQVLGNPLEPEVWDALDQVWCTPVKNLGGGVLFPSAVSIDASDGATSDAVYSYVRSRRSRFPGIKFMPIKGWSESRAKKEIYTPPSQKLDMDALGKASKYGLKLYMVGTNNAKDLIYARLRLKGEGSAQMHIYSGVPERYFVQMTNAVKAPGRGRSLVWQDLPGKPVEALDCEGYALHASRRLRVNTLTEAQWQGIEMQVRQRPLLPPPESAGLPVRVEHSGVPQSAGVAANSALLAAAGVDVSALAEFERALNSGRVAAGAAHGR